MEADQTRTELGINYHMVRKESADPKLTVSCGPHCRNTIMKLTKNAAALLLAASLAVSVCATPVFATDKVVNSTTHSDLKDSATVEVKYDVATTYTWTIHTDIDFGKTAGVDKDVERETNTVEVKANTIPEKKKLKITVEGSGEADASHENHKKFTIKNGPTGTEVLGYKVTKADTTEINPGDTVLEVKSGTSTGSTTLKYTLHTTTKTAEVAGEYRGTVTYTSEVVDDTTV